MRAEADPGRLTPRRGFRLRRPQLARGWADTSFVQQTGLTKEAPMDAQQTTASPDSDLSPAARQFLEETTMKSLLGIPDEALDAIMALAYQLYQVGRYADVEVLCL